MEFDHPAAELLSTRLTEDKVNKIYAMFCRMPDIYKIPEAGHLMVLAHFSSSDLYVFYETMVGLDLQRIIEIY